MFLKYSLLFLVFNVCVFCESAIVDTLTKCPLSDAECHKQGIQKIIKDISKTGVPEFDIPPLDPIELKNVTVKIAELLELSLIEGHVKGIKGCVIDKYVMNIEDEKAFVELTCDVTLKGKYKAFSSSPIIKNLLNGETVHGEGNAKVKIEKLKLKFDFGFFIEKRDGKLYIKCKENETKYEYDIQGSMSFDADQVYIGEVESSKVVVEMLNQNWRLLMSSFGKPIMDKVMTFVYDFIHRFIIAVPVSSFISDDLSSYARE